MVLGDTGKPKSGSGGGGGGGSAAGGGVTKRVIFCDGVSAPVPLLRLAGPVRGFHFFSLFFRVGGAKGVIQRVFQLVLVSEYAAWGKGKEVGVGCTSFGKGGRGRWRGTRSHLLLQKLLITTISASSLFP